LRSIQEGNIKTKGTAEYDYTKVVRGQTGLFQHLDCRHVTRYRFLLFRSAAMQQRLLELWQSVCNKHKLCARMKKEQNDVWLAVFGWDK